MERPAQSLSYPLPFCKRERKASCKSLPPLESLRLNVVTAECGVGLGKLFWAQSRGNRRAPGLDAQLRSLPPPTDPQAQAHSPLCCLYDQQGDPGAERIRETLGLRCLTHPPHPTLTHRGQVFSSLWGSFLLQVPPHLSIYCRDMASSA